MPLSLVAFSESVATTAATQEIAAVQDQHIKTQGDNVYVNEYNRLIGGMACVDAAALDVYFTSPTLRRRAPHHLQPITLGIVPGSPHAYDLFPDRSIPLDIDEQLQVEFMGSAAGATQKSVLAFLSNQEIRPVVGSIFTARATITLAQVAGAWAFSELTFADELPVGSYDIVGARAVIAGGVAFRFVPVGGTNRPGAPCAQLVSNVDNESPFRSGRLGVWCSFPHNSVPGVEVLGSAAAGSATYNVFVDLVAK